LAIKSEWEGRVSLQAMGPGGEAQIDIIAHFARTGKQMSYGYAQHDVM
jgi:hypothetical protein